MVIVFTRFTGLLRCLIAMVSSSFHSGLQLLATVRVFSLWCNLTISQLQLRVHARYNTFILYKIESHIFKLPSTNRETQEQRQKHQTTKKTKIQMKMRKRERKQTCEPMVMTTKGSLLRVSRRARLIPLFTRILISPTSSSISNLFFLCFPLFFSF